MEEETPMEFSRDDYERDRDYQMKIAAIQAAQARSPAADVDHFLRDVRVIYAFLKEDPND